MNYFIDLSHYAYAFQAMPPMIVGTCIAILGLMIMFRERASRVGVAFGAMTLSGACWLLSFGGIYAAQDPGAALLWIRLGHIGVAFIPSTLFRFALMSVGRYDTWRRLSQGTLIVSGAFAWSALFTARMVDGIYRYPWGYYPAYGELGTLFLAFFALLYGVTLWLFWDAFRRLPRGAPQIRLKTFFIAFCVGMLSAIDFLPSYHNAVYPVGFLPAYACVLLLAQIIWQHGFPDITPAFAVSHIVETMPSALFVVDQDGVIRIANPMACDLFGKPENKLLGTHLSGPLNGVVWESRLQEVQEKGALRDFEFPVYDSSGHVRLCSASISAIRDSSRRVAGYIFVARDITMQKRAEEAFQKSEERFRRLFESNIIGLTRRDANDRLLEANDAFLKMIGYTREDFVPGRIKVASLVPQEHQAAHQWIIRRVQENGVCPAVEKEYLRKDGTRIAVLVGAVRLQGSSDEVLSFVIDATERRAAIDALKKAYDELEIRIGERTRELREEILRREQAEEALRTQAVTDAMTGLYNRRGFRALAEQHRDLARRKKCPLVLFMMDLDGLKAINDGYGHGEGDVAILGVSSVIRKAFRSSDVMARFGGDEFAALVLEEHPEDAEQLRVRLEKGIAGWNHDSDKRWSLALSVGLARLDPDDHETLEEFMKRADQALYSHKTRKPHRRPSTNL